MMVDERGSANVTKAQDDKRVKRETAAMYRWRPLVVEIGAHSMRIRLKGKRLFYSIDYESIYSLAGKKEAERIRAERKAKKRNK